MKQIEKLKIKIKQFFCKHDFINMQHEYKDEGETFNISENRCKKCRKLQNAELDINADLDFYLKRLENGKMAFKR